jgi:hypothetical protein
MVFAVLVTVKSEVSRRRSLEDLIAESKVTDNTVLAPFQAALAAPESQRYLHQGDLEKRKNIVLYKTHKTAGGTLCSVLFRFASRHHSRIFNAGGDIGATFPPSTFRSWSAHHRSLEKAHYNTLFRHVGRSGELPPLHLHEMIEFFQYIIDKPFIITVLREPLQHTLSYIFFYHKKEVSKLGLTKTIDEHLPENPQCTELGITTDDQLNHFIESEMALFDMFCVTEHFDECMVMLRRRMNWDMVDITYLRVHDADEDEIMSVFFSSQRVFQRFYLKIISKIHFEIKYDLVKVRPFDSQIFLQCCPKRSQSDRRMTSEESHRVKPQSIDELDSEQHEMLRKKTVLDRKLYDAVLERFVRLWCTMLTAHPTASFIHVLIRRIVIVMFKIKIIIITQIY